MKELIKDKLYSFDEKVRVERGPQIIELDCTDENLNNDVTHVNYQIGKRDAYGRIIRYDEVSPEIKKKISTSMGVVNKGEKMHCVDWDAKHAPHIWKIYQIQEIKSIKNAVIESIESDRVVRPISRFIKVDELEDKKEALAFAKSLLKEMK